MNANFQLTFTIIFLLCNQIVYSIICPPDVTVGTDIDLCFASNVSIGYPTNVHPQLTVENNAPEVYELGTTTVTWSTYYQGNLEETCEQLITVEDTQSPILSTFSGDLLNEMEITPPMDSFPNFGNTIVSNDSFLITSDTYHNSINCNSCGAVIVYKLVNEEWIYHETLIGPTITTGDKFGQSLAINDNFLAIGAPEVGLNVGQVFMYSLQNDSWNYSQTLQSTTSNNFDYFGESITMNEGFLIIGYRGSVETFILDETNSWVLKQVIDPWDGNNSQYFGNNVILLDSLLLVSSSTDDYDESSNMGSLYLHKLDSDSLFIEDQKITPNLNGWIFRFGEEISMSKDLIASRATIFSQGELGCIFEPNSSGIWEQVYETSIHPYDQYYANTIASDENYVFFAWSSYDSLFQEIGAIDIYRRDPNQWQRKCLFTQNVLEQFANFGHEIHLNDKNVFVTRDKQNNEIYKFDRDTLLPTIYSECEVIVSPSTANDNCGEIYGTTTDPTEFNEPGNYSITWDYIDSNGNITTQEQKVMVTIPKPKTTKIGDWSTESLLTVPYTYQRSLGSATVIDEETLIASAPRSNVSGQSNAGRVFVFKLNDDEEWMYDHNLISNSPTANENFGQRLVLHDSTLVVSGNGLVFVTELMENGEFGDLIKLNTSDNNLQEEADPVITIYNGTLGIGLPKTDSYSGAVYLFSKDENGNWLEDQKITPSNSEINSSFGQSISLNSEILLIGSPNKNIASEESAGCIYMYTISSNIWEENQIITETIPAEYHYFGSDIKHNDKHIISGGGNHDISSFALDINNNPEFNQSIPRRSKSISLFEDVLLIGNTENHLYEFNNGSWNFTGNLFHEDYCDAIVLGHSTAIFNNHIVIGNNNLFAQGDGTINYFNYNHRDTLPLNTFHGECGSLPDSPTALNICDNTEIVGTTPDLFVDDIGNHLITWSYETAFGPAMEQEQIISIYDMNPPIPQIGGIGWQEYNIDNPENIAEDDDFGSAISINDSFALVGSCLVETEFENGGKAYIYKKNVNNNWIVNQELTPSESSLSAYFGFSVEINDSFSIVAAPREKVDDIIAVGAVYVFKLNAENELIESQRLLPPSLNFSGQFGTDIALTDDELFISQPGTNDGVIHIYSLNSDNDWIYSQSIEISTSTQHRQLGKSIKATDNTLVAGVADNPSAEESFFVFERVDGNWLETNSFDLTFPYAINMHRDQIVLSDSIIAISDYRYSKEKCEEGIIYLYNKNSAGEWNFQDTLFAPENNINLHRFGRSLELVGDTLYVTSTRDINTALKGGIYIFTNLTSDPTLVNFISHSLDSSQTFGSALAANNKDLMVADSYGLTDGIATGSIMTFEFSNQLPPINSYCDVTLSIPTAIDGCNGDIIIPSTDSPLTLSGVGNYNVIWSFTDIAGNTMEQVQNIEILQDTIPPELNCQMTHDIQLDNTGYYLLSESDLDYSVSNECEAYTVFLNQEEFTCEDKGIFDLFVHVTDIHDNQSSCSISLTISGGPTIVSNINDNEPNSLRDILGYACNDTLITFDSTLNTDTCHIQNEPIIIDRNYSIYGLGISNIHITGSSETSIFKVESESQFTLKDLSIIDTYSETNGGAFHNLGNLILENIRLQNGYELVNKKAFTNDGHLTIKDNVQIDE